MRYEMPFILYFDQNKGRFLKKGDLERESSDWLLEFEAMHSQAAADLRSDFLFSLFAMCSEGD